MKTHKSKILTLNFHKMKKVIHKKLNTFGHFYKQHWKMFVGAKLILLAIILTFSFSMRSDIGNVIRHGGIPTYAEWSCGNGACESVDAYCALSNTDCGMIKSSWDCSAIIWCSTQKVETASCSGTTFACKNLLDKSSCENVWCYRSGDAAGFCSNDNLGKLVDETCSSLKADACQKIAEKGAGDCSRTTGSVDVCAGKINSPWDETWCARLQDTFAIEKVDISTTRYPTYIEDSKSCPADCSTQTCGNGTIEWTEICDDGNTNSGDGCSSSCQSEWTAGTAVSTATEQHIQTIINNSQWWAQLKAKFCLANLMRMEGNIWGSLGELKNIMMSNSFDVNNFPYVLYLTTLDNIDANDLGSALNYFNGLLNAWGLAPASDQSAVHNQAQQYYNMFFWWPISIEWWAMTQLDDGVTYDQGIVAMCSPYYAQCGNGSVDTGEQCDDGNISDGDGCSSTCSIESTNGDERCGNGVCDNITAICELSNSNCNNIALTACNWVAWCAETASITYNGCTGTLFNCSSLSFYDQSACESVWCTRSNDKCTNVGIKGTSIKETCDSLSQQQCDAVKKYSAGDCTPEITSMGTDTCQWTIISPTNKYDCDQLMWKITSYGYFLNRNPSYVEDISSCPVDCNTPASTCGNGQVEWDEECDDRNTNDGDGCSHKCYREPACSISMTWATNESPFTAYFTYELYANAAIDYMQFDETTTGSIENPLEEPDVLWTFTHEYAQVDTLNPPKLFVYSANHPELTASCNAWKLICSPFTPSLCGSGALGNRWFQCADIPQSECMFLIEIYEATSGVNRDNHNWWLQDPEACDWHGVTCTTTKEGTFLESLNLSNNNLQGQLPATVDLLLPYIFSIINPTGMSIDKDASTASNAGTRTSEDASPAPNVSGSKLGNAILGDSVELIKSKEIIIATGNKFIWSWEEVAAKATGTSTFYKKFIGFWDKRINLLTPSADQTASFSKINLGGFDFTSLPFLHFTTLNLSHNHLEWTIPMGYTLIFPMLETLNFSYNSFASVFGQEPLISIPSIPWYTSLVDLAHNAWLDGLLDAINNISFTSTGNFRPYFVFNFMMQRFDIDHAIVAAIDKDSLDTLSSVANIMWVAPDGASKIWANIYDYYQKHLLATPKYMSSMADYAFNVSQELKDWFAVDFFQSIIGSLKDENKQWKFDRNSLGNAIGSNPDILDNMTPLITSMVQQLTNVVNHLQTVNFSHNSITTLPENLPLNACMSSFDLSYNQLNKELPFISYFWYNKWPIIHTQQNGYFGTGPTVDTTLQPRDTATTIKGAKINVLSDFYTGPTVDTTLQPRDTATTIKGAKINVLSDFYSDLVKWGIGIQVITHLKYGEVVTGGTITGVVINDEKVTTIITDHWNFSSQIVIPDTMPTATWTIFGKNCTQSPIDGTITCGDKDCKVDDPKCAQLVRGQYVWIFAVIGDNTYSSICAYSGAANGMRSYNPDKMTFDKDNVCGSLGMYSLFNFDVLRQTIWEPVCDRTSDNIEVNFSHNQLGGYLPEIVTTNSTTWSQLKGLTLWQKDNAGKGPLRLFMQSSTPVKVNARLNDNNLIDDRQPNSRTNNTKGWLAYNCLTRPGLIDEQTTYLGTFREGWNTQRMCNIPRITYSPDQTVGSTENTVTATVHLPEGWDCSILNNDYKNTYTFDTNGAFAFEVNCTGFTNPWFIIWKVNWINSNTTILVNAKDFNTNLDIYDSNTKDTNISSTEGSLLLKKKLIAKTAMNTIKWVDGADITKTAAKIVTTNNLNFVNDVKVYNPITITTKTWIPSTPNISVDIPTNVNLKEVKDSKQTDYTKIFYAPENITDQTLLDKFLTETKLSKVINIIHVGSKTADTSVVAEDEDTQAIQDFTLTIETTRPAGTIGKVFSSQDGNTWTYYGTSVVITSWATTMFYLKVPHLTYFWIGETGSGSTGTWTGTTGTWTGTTGTTWTETPGGIIVSNGSMRLAMDYCPDGDASPSYYDNTCVWVTHSWTVTSDAIDTNELRSAYFYALDHGLITSASSDARLYDKIRRRDLAKLIAIYAKNVVWLVPSTTRNCAFTDLSKETVESKAYIMRACRLGIMWVHKDGDTPKVNFDPNNLVTRAEFATVLSRLLYDGTYNVPLNSTYQRYDLHMKALKAKGIIKNISQPRLLETKWFVLIMLQRADELIINAGPKK